METAEINPENLWRLETPGHAGWKKTARAGDPDKYFVVSMDSHAQEPADLWEKRIEERYRHRIPHMKTDEQGRMWRIVEGFKPVQMNPSKFEGEDRLRTQSGADPAKRHEDNLRDGVDAELIFPNKGLVMWATPDPVFANAQCRVWNDWAHEIYSPYRGSMLPVAAVASGDLEGCMREIERTARLGFRAVALPAKPMWGPPDADAPNYDLAMYDPLWALLQDLDLPAVFHVATGRGPRGAKGEGGAVINYAAHALTQCVDPLTCLCASGVLDRFPKLRFAAVEAGIGWIPWLLDAMDEGYRKHHMWVRPKLKLLPSDYFRRQGFATFQEDPAGLALARDYELEDNFMWASDYPHHEGTWPHSAEAIERTMGGLREEARAKILGLNAARFLKLDVPSSKREPRRS